MGILLLLFVVDGLSLWFTARLDYIRTLEHARVILQKTAISLEEMVRRTIDATEAILHNRVVRLQEKGLAATVSSPEEWDRLRTAADTLPDPGSLWLLDDKADNITGIKSWIVGSLRDGMVGRQGFEPWTN